MASRNGRGQKAELVAATLHDYRNELTAFVRARVPLTEVEDVLQVAAMRAIEGAGSLKDPARVLPWLYRVHRNTVTDETRKRASRQRLLVADELVPDVPRAEAEVMCGCSISQARGINPSYASVLAIVDMGGATLAEAAQALGTSANNVAVRLHRARKALKKTMLEHCGVTSLRECADCRCVYDGCCSA